MSMNECNDADETWPYRHSNYYGYSKILAEKEVINFQKKAQTEVVILRPTWIIGPRDRYRRYSDSDGKRSDKRYSGQKNFEKDTDPAGVRLRTDLQSA